MNKKNTYSPLRVFLVVAIFLIVMAALAISIYLKERIPSNPPGTIGNTAGNLNNAGLFCEHDGTVYFSNVYDGGALYAMDPSETNVRRLNTDQVRNILAGGDYLYYFRVGAAGNSGLGSIRSPRSFNRCKLDGSHPTALVRDVVVTGQLVGDDLYLLVAGDDHPSFYKLKTDKSDRTDLADYTINPACAVDGVIYYNGTQSNHFLYQLNTSNDNVSVVWEGNLWYPAVEGDYVYYMDVANNYRLCRYSLSQNVVEVLTNDRVDCFNVGYGYIYYQTNGSNAQLVCMRTDGSEKQVVAMGVFTDINLTSQYAYFRDYFEEGAMYHSYLGSSSFDVFSQAQAAVQ
ncbi:MAG: DUF5050 domain-containing protein [Candidatus Gastranaerophilales bacterium]|nr:DUF5050 domain-containing protein [Candidatus Gastranaerophilales bacterium]